MIDLENEDVIVLDESRCQNKTIMAWGICNPTIMVKKIKINLKKLGREWSKWNRFSRN